MRHSLACGVTVILLVAAGMVYAQAAGGGGAGAGRGQGAGRRPAAGGAGMVASDTAFNQLIAALGDVNLSPGFTLSDEQKQKLQAIRDEVKAAAEKWRKEHEDELTKIQEERRQAGDAGGTEGMRAVMEKMRALRATYPSTAEAQKQVLALLTEEQRKAMEARQAELRSERQDRVQFAPQPAGGGRGARGGRGGGAGSTGQ